MDSDFADNVVALFQAAVGDSIEVTANVKQSHYRPLGAAETAHLRCRDLPRRPCGHAEREGPL